MTLIKMPNDNDPFTSALVTQCSGPWNIEAVYIITTCIWFFFTNNDFIALNFAVKNLLGIQW
jgi:hypothetical protein